MEQIFNKLDFDNPLLVGFISFVLITLFQFYNFYILIGTGFTRDVILASILFTISLYVFFYIYKK